MNTKFIVSSLVMGFTYFMQGFLEHALLLTE